MCDQTEIEYLDGEVVWVKLGSCWWPGEVVGSDKLPPGLLSSFRKPPIAVVQFFQEDTYEYVKNINSIYKYNCSRKNEFIKKGLDAFRTKHGHMEKFPEDIVRAETVTGGDPEILTTEEFQETKKESYAGLFGDKKASTTPGKRGRGAKGKIIESPRITTPVRKFNKGNSDYKVHILVQPKTNNESAAISTPSTSRAGSEPLEDKSEKSAPEAPPAAPAALAFPTTPSSSSGIYSCHACPFTSTRLNVMILHNKSHSAGFTPYTPSPVRKKPTPKQTPKATPTTKTPVQRRPRAEKTEKSVKKVQGKKRAADEQAIADAKKSKTDEEIKTSLLADWDDAEEESIEDDSAHMSVAKSPEIPVGAESPALPTPGEMTGAALPDPALPDPALPDPALTEPAMPDPALPDPALPDPALPNPALPDPTPPEKPECSKDTKYEFCEDEDWPVEELGRKIPRIKNSKRKSESKSLSLDEDEVAKEVAELLSNTTVPELPSAPEPLKAEENFPERPIEKTPDKEKGAEAKLDTQPTKTIFKTKTFFRSRHSRSQDAIGKYVAEQLSAAERMNASDCELNGAEVAEPGARDSPPAEAVRVARLAPKIQLKKMKAEAAQLKEREKALEDGADNKHEPITINNFSLSQDYFEPLRQEIATEPVIEQTDFKLDSSDKVEDGLKTHINDPVIREPSPSLASPVKTETINPVSVSPIKTSASDKCNNESPVELPKTTSLSDPIIGSPVKSHLTENQAASPKKSKVSEPKIVSPLKSSRVESFMNETTASAVDALLSVSRDADRVTRNVSDDVPEDMFEDDTKVDSVPATNTGHESENNLEIIQELPATEIINEVVESVEDVVPVEETITGNADMDTSANVDFIRENINKDIAPESVSNGKVEEMEVAAAETVSETPTESDLQIAEALINLPATALKNKSNDSLLEAFEKQMETCEDIETTEVTSSEENMSKTDDIETSLVIQTAELPKVNEIVTSDDKSRFNTDQEESENLNAAQSLVQMSEYLEHSVNNVVETNCTEESTSEPGAAAAGDGGERDAAGGKKSDLTNNGNTPKYETTSSKLLKMLKEPFVPKILPAKAPAIIKKTLPTILGNEKILNFGVGTSPLIKPKPQVSKQKIIIRKTTSTLINNLNEPAKQEKIILSRTNKAVPDGSSVQTYTIQASPDAAAENSTIVIQQKMKKVTPPKLQKIKPQTSLIAISSEPPPAAAPATQEEALFDINSMPIVLSDDILTPENIDKMPIVMSDGNLVTKQVTAPAPAVAAPKPVKPKQTVIETQKVISCPKPEVKTLLMNPITESSKTTTPNILSKSTKLRNAKSMLVIDKATGKQKIIMTKAEPIKQGQKLQNVGQIAAKTEKFIILPTNNSAPRPNRTQKIVIDPATGKAHVLGAPGAAPADSKPVSARLVAGGGGGGGGAPAGGTVMIITNAQGTQSRIVLTPEHEKLLFPKKQPANITQLKAASPRLALNATTKPPTIVAAVTQSPMKTQTKIVPKQKGAIITSKGQLILGGRVATTSQNIAPMPEIRPATTKRTMTAEPKKLIQAVQKTNSEPLIFLQQKSGAVMQLTAAQFEHLQRTGQIVQKTAAPAKPQESKIIVQKSVTISSSNPLSSVIQKQQRVRPARPAVCSPSPAKKVKQEIIIKPASPMPSLTPIVKPTTPPRTPTKPVTVTTASSPYPELDNFEEMLPSTAIARPEPVKEPEPAPAPAAPEPEPQPATDAAPPLGDSQLLAVPGEHFGGPLGSFYLCVEENGLYTPIDNRPLMLENNQLVPMELAPAQPERRDILEAALANSDVFHEPPPRDDAPDFRDLNANVSVHCRVSETSTTLNQPIMTPVEVPSNVDSEPSVPASLEDGLAVIGVTPHTVPTSLELPITVTDPRIAPKTSDPLCSTTFSTTVLPSPGVDMGQYVGAEEATLGTMSMPLLTEEEAEAGAGKSMPLLTEEAAASSADSSLERAEGWPRPPLTPPSDHSEASAEIPLQPQMQISVNHLSGNS